MSERRIYETSIRKIIDQLGKSAVEANRLVRTGGWRLWSATATAPEKIGDVWSWDFSYRFHQNGPIITAEQQQNADYGPLISSWIRLAYDDEMCNVISDRAMKIGAPGYHLVYRARLRNGQTCWIEENVLLQPISDGRWYVVGICSPTVPGTSASGYVIGDMDADQLMKQTPADVDNDSLDEPVNVGVCQLQRELKRLKEDMHLLVRSGQWLIWSANVSKPTPDSVLWHWDFSPEYSVTLPAWFDVDRWDDTDLSQTLSRVRLDEDSLICNANVNRALALGLPGYSQTYRVRLRDGRISWVEENVSILATSATTFRLVGICIDATERKRVEEDLLKMREELIVQNEELSALHETLIEEKHALSDANTRLASLATTDGLTGIHNHRAFQQRLESEWRVMTRGKPLSLLLLDIDHFKHYNDSFGHPAGDEVLIHLGQIMRDCARDSDFIARYGGEEFVVVLPQTDGHGARVIAERLRESIEQTVWKYRPVTVSIGVATASHRVQDSKELISLADRGLYLAKASGRNRVCEARGDAVNISETQTVDAIIPAISRR
ncbi:MAG: diguanylate cyclase [Capsulimonadaceae bacterium]